MDGKSTSTNAKCAEENIISFLFFLLNVKNSKRKDGRKSATRKFA